MIGGPFGDRMGRPGSDGDADVAETDSNRMRPCPKDVGTRAAMPGTLDESMPPSGVVAGNLRRSR